MRFVSRLRSSVVTRSWRFANDLRGRLGMNESYFRSARGARILVYHGICQAHHTRYNGIFLRLKSFEQHLRFYSEYFHLVSLDDYFNHRFRDDRFNVCITFDDGFANNYKYVLPLMNHYEVPVAFFPTAISDAGCDILWNDFLAMAQRHGPVAFEFGGDRFVKDRFGRYLSCNDGTSLKDLSRNYGLEWKAAMMNAIEVPFRGSVDEDFWRQMSSSQIEALSGSRWATIGCHGYCHSDLSALPLAAAAREMALSRAYLERATGRDVRTIAFPYGAYTRQVVAVAKSLGFTQLLAADFLFIEDATDPAMRERFGINPYLSFMNQMLAIVDGKYQ